MLLLVLSGLTSLLAGPTAMGRSFPCNSVILVSVSDCGTFGSLFTTSFVIVYVRQLLVTPAFIGGGGEVVRGKPSAFGGVEEAGLMVYRETEKGMRV